MSLVAKVTNAGRAALVNAQNTGTAPVVIASCGISASALVPSAAATSLPGEIKRIATLSGDVVADDTIHLVVRDAGADVYTVRSLALYLADGTLFAIYGQASEILTKVAASVMLLAVDIRFADVDAASLTFGDANFLNPPATTEVLGVVEMATVAEAVTGTDNQRAVTPAGLTGAINARLGGSLGDVWRASNDGAGSGLDADLLDGQHGSWFSDIPARLGYTPLNRAGDTITGNLSIVGTTYFNSDPWFFAATFEGKPGFSFDSSDAIYFDRAANAVGVIVASQWVGSWSGSGFIDVPGGYRVSGNIVWHAGNDGAGSGLDADLLDGKHASEFLSAADFATGAGPSGRWWKRPDGGGGVLIEQRGKGANIMNEGTIYVPFVIPFTDLDSINVQLTIIQQGSDSDMFIALENGSLTLNGFTLRYQSTGSDIAYGFHWQATGY